MRWTAVTVVLGALFIGNQAYEWSNLAFTISSHPFGSVFYLMTGFHGLHVLGGMAAMALLIARVRLAGRADQGWVEAISYYWHFVDVVWIGAVLRDLRSSDEGALLASASVLVRGRRASGTAIPTSRGAGPRRLSTKAEHLFETACSSCHGVDGRGHTARPAGSTSSGAAGADFMLSTGRMPLEDPHRQPVRKPPAFDGEQIAGDHRVRRVAGNGPEVPEVDVDRADLSLGQELYSENCAACHSSAGAGGAVGAGLEAPSLAAVDAGRDSGGYEDRARGDAGVRRVDAQRAGSRLDRPLPGLPARVSRPGRAWVSTGSARSQKALRPG